MALNDVIITLIEVLFLLALSPLLSGIIRKIKAWMQCRKGPGILQPYRDIWKLLHKGTVVSKEASWLFLVIPYICFGAMLCLAVMMPVFYTGSSNGIGGHVGGHLHARHLPIHDGIGRARGRELVRRDGQQQGDDDIRHRRAHIAPFYILRGGHIWNHRPIGHFPLFRLVRRFSAVPVAIPSGSSDFHLAHGRELPRAVRQSGHPTWS